MISLGLDPSLRAFGWCIYTQNEGVHILVASGHVKSEIKDVPVTRYMQFREMVNDLIVKYKPDNIGIESPAYDAGPFQSVHFALMMYCLEAAFNHRRDVVLFDPATVKFLAKMQPGKSLFTKADMIQVVKNDILSDEDIDNNEADAYVVAKYANRFYRLLNGHMDPDLLEPNESKVFIERTKKSKKGSTTITKRISHIFKENHRYFLFSKIPEHTKKLPSISEIPNSIVNFLKKD